MLCKPPSGRFIPFKKSLSAFYFAALALLFTFSGSPSFDIPQANAQSAIRGFGPQRYQDGKHYGTGVYFAPYQFTVYTQPDDKSPVIATYRWNRKSGSGDIDVETPNSGVHAVYAEKTFICFYPALDVAMLAVLSENGQGWAEVIYDQVNNRSGWVRLKPDTDASKPAVSSTDDEPAHFGVYQTWVEFMRLNAKVSGIYWLSGVSAYHRSLRTKDEDTARLLPVTLMRTIKVRFVRGNWLLVEALDFEHNTPIGWLRWRDDDGNLMVFPNVSGQRTPIVTTGQ